MVAVVDDRLAHLGETNLRVSVSQFTQLSAWAPAMLDLLTMPDWCGIHASSKAASSECTGLHPEPGSEKPWLKRINDQFTC